MFSTFIEVQKDYPDRIKNGLFEGSFLPGLPILVNYVVIESQRKKKFFITLTSKTVIEICSSPSLFTGIFVETCFLLVRQFA